MGADHTEGPPGRYLEKILGCEKTNLKGKRIEEKGYWVEVSRDPGPGEGLKLI